MLKICVILGLVGFLGALNMHCQAEEGTSVSSLKPFGEQGTYLKDGKKYECGFYAGGKNEMPAEHRKAGEKIAAALAPDPKSGKIVITTVGHSNPLAYFNAYAAFLQEEAKQGRVNPAVQLAVACQGGKMCPDWAAEFRSSGPTRLNAETQVVFLLTSYYNASRARTEQKCPEIFKLTFDEKLRKIKEDTKVILQGCLHACPKLKLAYISCDTWRGNSGLEPFVWEEALAFKELIADQIKGDPELAYDGPKRKCPWLAWGGYIWENNPSKDRFVGDGVHPSESGKAFAYGRWHDIMTKDSTAQPWFLGKGGAK